MLSIRLLVVCLLLLRFHASLAQDAAIEEVNEKKQAVAFNTQGFQLLEQGNAEDAKAYFIRAIALDPAEITYYLNMGDACHQTKDWATALDNFNAAIRVLPQESDLYYYRAEVYNKQKDYTKAIADFTTAIRLGGAAREVRPLLYLYYFNRGVAYLKLQKYGEAASDFTQTLKLDENHYGAYANRGIARYSTKDKTGACQDWNKAYSLGYEGIKPQLMNHCK